MVKLLYGPLIGALWAGWFIYWQIAARDVKAVRRQESRLSRAAHILPLLLATALLVYPEKSAGWVFTRFMARTIATYWIGVGLLAAGLSFSILARRYLGRNWSGTVTLKEDHELIRTGPYRWVRHPIYTGILLGFVGSAVALAEWRGLVAAALVTIAFLLKIRLEERWMIETFGDAYRRYRREVKALIPFVL
jgi:protein-S-isoprenylcysteine O-methyltransferase Ste14